jgi:hypothetical protein
MTVTPHILRIPLLPALLVASMMGASMVLLAAPAFARGTTGHGSMHRLSMHGIGSNLRSQRSDACATGRAGEAPVTDVSAVASPVSAESCKR